MKIGTSTVSYRQSPYALPSLAPRQMSVQSLGAKLLQDLRHIDRKVSQLPRGSDLKDIHDRMQLLTPMLCAAARTGDFKEAQACQQLLKRIRTFAEAVLQTDRLVLHAKESCLDEVRRVCLTSSELVHVSRESSAPRRDQVSLPQHDQYCCWFLNHLSHPYPTPKDCKLLLEQVPSDTISQLRTWFTNTRRRSGWTDMYKKYTDGNANKMTKLVDAITASPFSEQASPPLFDNETIEEARADLEAVKEYFGRSEERKKVSSWINDSIEKTKHLPTAIIRTPQSSPASSDRSSPPSSPTPSPTRKRGRKNAKPSLYAKPNIAVVVETDDIPVIAPHQTLFDPMW